MDQAQGKKMSGGKIMQQAGKVCAVLGIGLMVIGVMMMFVPNIGFYGTVYMFMIGIPLVVVGVGLKMMSGNRKATTVTQPTADKGQVEGEVVDEKK